jgi:hypothetical protein
MNKKGRLTGIMGTIILHLIAGIIFMSLQLRALDKKTSTEYEIELSPELIPEPQVKEEIKVENKTSEGEDVKGEDQQMYNIAKNVSAKQDEKIDPKEYIDKVKEELIKSGKLGVNNFIDEQKQGGQVSGTEDISSVADTTGKKIKETKGNSAELAANFKGPTRIYYDLFGRNHMYLPIPIYKCEGSGTVVLTIEVDQKGNVQKAQIAERESNVTDQCLVETAINTALQSKFNPDSNAPKIQIGTLTYKFVAQ